MCNDDAERTTAEHDRRMTDRRLPTLTLARGEAGTAFDPHAHPELFDGVMARRIVAYLVDIVLIAVLAIVGWVLSWLIGVLTLGLFVPIGALALALLPLLYHTGFTGYYGATPGMMLFDLEVRSLAGGKPDYVQAFVMTALFYLSVAVTGWLVLIVALFNDRRRTMHDFFAGVVVLRRSEAGAGAPR